MTVNVGIIGLGIMGGAFAKNLIDAGLNVTGYDIVADNVEAPVKLSGSGAKSPKWSSPHYRPRLRSTRSLAAPTRFCRPTRTA